MHEDEVLNGNPSWVSQVEETDLLIVNQFLTVKVDYKAEEEGLDVQPIKLHARCAAQVVNSVDVQ